MEAETVITADVVVAVVVAVFVLAAEVTIAADSAEVSAVDAVAGLRVVVAGEDEGVDREGKLASKEKTHRIKDIQLKK